MRKAILFVLACGCTGCGLTDPRYLGVPVSQVAIGDSTYEVRRRGTTARALRVTPAPPEQYVPAMTRAVLAIEQATGCRVRRAGGDPSAAEARLDCGGAAGPRTPPVRYTCDAFEVYDGVFELRCRPEI